MLFLMPNRRIRPMPRVHLNVIPQWEILLLDAFNQSSMIPAGQVGAANAVFKKHVPCN